MNPSSRVRTTIRLAMGRLTQCYEDLRDHPNLPAVYPEYLVLSHMIVRASVPLMEEARQRASNLGDSLGDGLASYLDEHIPEERDHDEWALDDLAALGLARADVLARMPPPSVAAMVGAQYYWVRHHHPIAILGYLAVVEGYPAPPEEIEGMAARSNLPPSAFSTWARHAALDPGHNRELDELLDILPLGEREVRSICTSAIATIRYSNTVFAELLERHPVAGSRPGGR